MRRPFGRPAAIAVPFAMAFAVGLLPIAPAAVRTPLSAQQPRTALAGHIGGRFGDVAAGDGIVWLATGPRLVATSVDASGSPIAASELLPGIVRGLAVAGDRAVVAGDGFGLAVVDLAPASGPPRVLGRAAVGFDGFGVAVSGTLAVATAGDGRVVAFDLAQPALPYQMGAVVLSRPELGQLRPDRVALQGDRAVVSLVPPRSGLPGGAVQGVDLSDPRRPVALGRLETPGVVGELVVREGVAFVAESGIGLRTVDVEADPPVTVGTLPPGALADGVAGGLAVEGSRAWLVGRGSSASVGAASLGTAWAIDVADPAAPALVAEAALPLPAARAARAGDGLIVAQPDGALTAIALIDGVLGAARTAHAPAVVHAAEADPDAPDIAWLASGAGGVWAVDLAADGGPRPLAHVPTMGSAVDVAARDGLAFAVTADPSLLVVIDAAAPAAPRQLGVLVGQGRPIRVAAPAGASTVLVADIDEGLQFVDASDPSQPRLALALRRTGFAWDVAVDGARGIVAAGSAGLATLDLSRLDRPIVAGTIPTFGSAYGVAFAGRHAVAATLDGGLAIYDVLQPYQAGEVGRLRGGQAVDVAALGGYAYAAMADAGLRVVDVRQPSGPLLAEDVDLPGWTASVAAWPADGPTTGWVLASAREAGVYAFAADAPPLPEPTAGPTVTPFSTPIPSALPTRPARPTATAVPRPIYLPAVVSAASAGPKDVPARVIARMPAAALGGGELIDLAADGDRAWIAAGEGDGGAVLAVDLGSPSNPRVVGRLTLDAWPHGLARGGDRLAVALWDDGLEVVDVAGAVPRSVQRLTLPLWPLHVAAAGERMAATGALPLGGGRLGLAVAGAAVPPAEGAFGRLALDAGSAGDRAYVADGDAGLRAFDVAPDGALTAAGTLSQVGAADVALDASGDAIALLYRGVGLRPGGLLLAQARPALARRGTWTADDEAAGRTLRRVALDADGRCAWLLDRDGLLAVDASSPAQPAGLGRIQLVAPVPGLAAGDLTGLAVLPRAVLVLDRRAGLIVLERTAAGGGCGARPEGAP